MIEFILAAASASPAVPPKVCEPAQPLTCEDTNRLMWSKTFIADLTTFVGEGKASWLYPDGNKIDQVIAVLGGPPEVPVLVGGDLYRFSACRHKSCMEKGAVFVTDTGQIRAVLVLHLNCTEDCDSAYRLTLLVKARDAKLMALAVSWADEVIASQHATSPEAPGSLKSVDVDIVR